MTTLGHSMIGLALFSLVIPKPISGNRRWLWGIVFIAIANIPDWPLPGWGHRRLEVSHSLWVNMVLCAGMITLLWKWCHGEKFHARILFSCAVAWLSHIVLDTLYGNLPGVAIYWPFSDALASLPLPWLKTLPYVPPPFGMMVIKVLFFEFITFAPLILLAYWVRQKSPWLNKF